MSDSFVAGLIVGWIIGGFSVWYVISTTPPRGPKK